jgi:hypothetical protein
MHLLCHAHASCFDLNPQSGEARDETSLSITYVRSCARSGSIRLISLVLISRPLEIVFHALSGTAFPERLFMD